eukprot:248620-Amphidinium_carterae.1
MNNVDLAARTAKDAKSHANAFAQTFPKYVPAFRPEQTVKNTKHATTLVESGIAEVPSHLVQGGL